VSAITILYYVIEYFLFQPCADLAVGRDFFKVKSGLQPLPVLYYLRLAMLWAYGGFYTDLGIIWRLPPPRKRFLDMGPGGNGCRIKAPQNSKDHGWPSHVAMHFPKEDPFLSCKWYRPNLRGRIP